jgi:fructoselysine-6-P-deglycase FrlB-like protein
VTGSEAHIEQARRGEFFTAPVLESDLGTLLHRQEEIDAIFGSLKLEGIQRVFFVACGGAYAALYSGAYLLNRWTTIPSQVYSGFPFIRDVGPSVGPGTLVVLHSYSGETEDTVAALRFARERGATTLAFVRRSNTTLARKADAAIAYDSIALYASPLLLSYLLAMFMAEQRGQGMREVEALRTALPALPEHLGQVLRVTEPQARDDAARLRDVSLLYVLGSGPLWGLAYKFALTVFMENLRIHGSLIDPVEFRHGPCEMLERQQPHMVFLLGGKDTRTMDEQVLRFVQEHGAHTLVYDAAALRTPHELLSPFTLLTPLEAFTVYGSVERGIYDLDARIFMGKGVLGAPGAVWP